MNINTISIDSYEGDLRSLLLDKVFHATTYENHNLIRKEGSIKPNTEFTQASPFASSENGYFRNRNCVSRFDYRNHISERWQFHEHDCLPTKLLEKSKALFIFFIPPEQYPNIISWQEWEKEQAYRLRVVPYVEAGYEGNLCLSLINERLMVYKK